jgi:hypothetical protein
LAIRFPINSGPFESQKSFDGAIGGGDSQPCAALGSNPVLVRQHRPRCKNILKDRSPISPQRAKLIVNFQSGFVDEMALRVQKPFAVP